MQLHRLGFARNIGGREALRTVAARVHFVCGISAVCCHSCLLGNVEKWAEERDGGCDYDESIFDDDPVHKGHGVDWCQSISK